ncbi:DEAD/DEAH box helicase [Desulfoplanes formicivorans]|nr:DEAD/DEAH box helicase [Desulfoplanes formicivorans]
MLTQRTTRTATHSQIRQPRNSQKAGQTQPDPKGVFARLIPELQKAVADKGYSHPTPIQEQAIPFLTKGQDIIGCAQTGTGKTAAFSLPILEYLFTNPKKRIPGNPRVLVLAPTRELAAQIDASIQDYSKYMRIHHTVIFGGVSQNPQVKALKRGLDILVATPGRLLDLMGQGYIDLSRIEIFVLDEADRMLDMGFLPDIRRVIAQLPVKRQSLFFSATMEKQIMDLATTLVTNPARVNIAPEQPAVERIVQKLYFVDKNAKPTLLNRLMQDASFKKVIVFTQMKHMANRVVAKLTSAGVSAAAIHGNKSQNARTQALNAYKKGKIRVLVATDIAARGIDVDGITHVINYDLPVEPETYVHRIGRTARAGAQGMAISFCSAPERDYLRSIERLLRKSVPVVMDHPFHSEEAKNATGAAARPAPRGQQTRSRRPRSQTSRIAPASPRSRQGQRTPRRSRRAS